MRQLTAIIVGLIGLGLTGLTTTVHAEESLVTVGTPTGVTLGPAGLNLVGKRARQQLLVTAKYKSGELRDLTTVSKITSSNPKVVRVEAGLAFSVGDGSAQLTAEVGGQKASIAVTVKGTAAAHPFSFQNEMLAALSKGGCNAGACHGSPSGKAGFRLSLRSFDPPLDIMTLRHEYFGRRTNSMNPADSLVIKKALMEVAHGGGKRFRKNDPVYNTMVGWIGEGLRLDPEGAPTLLKTELHPKKRILQPASNQQQLFLMGHFSDGTVRDLTPLTVFTSSNESVGTVSASGLVE
ncbi:MAG: hypothetical protein VB859_17145, partial [Planctomycetaceae bacterium]